MTVPQSCGHHRRPMQRTPKTLASFTGPPPTPPAQPKAARNARPRQREAQQASASDPLPIPNLGHVFAVTAHVLAMFDEFVAQALTQMAGLRAQGGNEVEGGFG